MNEKSIGFVLCSDIHIYLICGVALGDLTVFDISLIRLNINVSIFIDTPGLRV